MNNSDETVYIAKSGNHTTSGIYHTDSECDALRSAKKVRERNLSTLSTFRECRICTGEVDMPSLEERELRREIGQGKRKLLEQLDPDDLPLTDDRGNA